MPQKQEKQLETSREIQEQEDSPEAETESTSSIESLGVPQKISKNTWKQPVSDTVKWDKPAMCKKKTNGI